MVFLGIHNLLGWNWLGREPQPRGRLINWSIQGWKPRAWAPKEHFEYKSLAKHSHFHKLLGEFDNFKKSYCASLVLLYSYLLFLRAHTRRKGQVKTYREVTIWKPGRESSSETNLAKLWSETSGPQNWIKGFVGSPSRSPFTQRRASVSWQSDWSSLARRKVVAAVPCNKEDNVWNQRIHWLLIIFIVPSIIVNWTLQQSN